MNEAGGLGLRRWRRPMGVSHDFRLVRVPGIDPSPYGLEDRHAAITPHAR